MLSDKQKTPETSVKSNSGGNEQEIISEQLSDEDMSSKSGLECNSSDLNISDKSQKKDGSVSPRQSGMTNGVPTMLSLKKTSPNSKQRSSSQKARKREKESGKTSKMISVGKLKRSEEKDLMSSSPKSPLFEQNKAKPNFYQQE